MKNQFQKLIKNRAFLATLLCGIAVASVACVTAGISGKIGQPKESKENSTEELDLNTQNTEEPLAQAEPTSPPATQPAGEDNEPEESKEPSENMPPQEVAQGDDPAFGSQNQEGDEPSESGDAVNESNALSVDSSNVAAAFPVTFHEESFLSWPVVGEVLMTFSPDSTVYFATLEQYKTNDAILIQADADTSVHVPHNCVVTSIGHREDIGDYVTLDIGDGYAVTLGQLKDISVNVSETVPEGTVIAKIAQPTRYYTVEGYHLYVRMTHNLEAIDPLDYLQ